MRTTTWLRRIGVSVGALMLLAAVPTSLQAADAPMPVGSWTGCYVGGHAGYGISDTSGVYDNADAAGPTNLNNLDPDGGVIGGQIGCRFQMDNSIVVGVEGDGAGSFMDDRVLSVEPAPRGPDPVNADIDYLASLRGVLGFTTDALGTDVMLFATGGVAFMGGEIRARNALNGTSGRLDFDEVGGVVGGGAEFQLTPMVSAGVAYLHYFFGDRHNLNRAPFTNNTDVDAGDNYRVDNVGVIRAFVNVKLDDILGAMQ